MKLCVPAEAPSLGAAVDARLGRAACFVLVDAEAGTLVASAANQQNRQAAQGAGIQAAQTIVGLAPDAVLCTHCGPKAFRVLQAAHVRVYLGAAGTVAEAVQAFNQGQLQEAVEANVEGHW